MPKHACVVSKKAKYCPTCGKNRDAPKNPIPELVKSAKVEVSIGPSGNEILALVADKLIVRINRADWDRARRSNETVILEAN